jgi:hypothetical protein
MFQDEISSTLLHDKRGVVSMANHGMNTNGSQFFITFDASSHLDGKHTIFGQVVESLETLDKIEMIPTYTTNETQGQITYLRDEPKTLIQILQTDVLRDPFPDIINAFDIKRNAVVHLQGFKQQAHVPEKGSVSTVRPLPGTQNESIGRYIRNNDEDTKKRTLSNNANTSQEPNPSLKRYKLSIAPTTKSSADIEKSKRFGSVF